MKRNALHLSIVILTLLCFSESCAGPLRYPNANHTDTSAEYITVGGMKYLVLTTPKGTHIVNVTKDSLEVILRRRNEKYLELANRQFKHLQK